jgi:hypothetical protein
MGYQAKRQSDSQEHWKGGVFAGIDLVSMPLLLNEPGAVNLEGWNSGTDRQEKSFFFIFIVLVPPRSGR